MGIAMPVGAQRPALCAGFRSRQAHIGSLERPSPRSVTALQAAFRTSTGSIRPGRQFRRSHKFDPATLERDAKEFWGVTLQAMDVVADRYRSLAKARISGGETTDLIKELFPTPKVPAGAKPSAAVPEGCREWHRAYSSLNPQKGKSSMYLSLIHISRCRRIERCRSRWWPYP